MSKKSIPVKLAAVESSEDSEKATGESKEHCTKEKKQTSNKKPVEDIKMAEKETEAPMKLAVIESAEKPEEATSESKEHCTKENTKEKEQISNKKSAEDIKMAEKVTKIPVKLAVVESTEEPKEAANESKEHCTKEKEQIPNKKSVEDIKIAEKVTKVSVKLAVVESAEEPKEAANESKEHCTKEKEQIPNKKSVEDIKIAEKVTEIHETETSQNIKTTSQISTSKPKDVATEMPKTPAEVFASTKLGAPKRLEVTKICPDPAEIINSLQFRVPKINYRDMILPRFLVGNSTRSNTSAESEEPKTKEIRSLPTSPTEICPSAKPETPKETGMPETCEMIKSLLKKPTPTKLEIPKEPEIPTASSSNKSKDHKISEISHLVETPHDASTSTKRAIPDYVDLLEMSNNMSHIFFSETFSGLSKPKVPETNISSPISIDEFMIGYDKYKMSQSNNPMSAKEDNSSDNENKKLLPIIKNKKSLREMQKRKVLPPLSTPNFKEPPLVLATHHLVPSLPIGLFEVLADMIEVVTNKPVVLMHECRENRPIPSDLIDIIVLPASESWNGLLVQASFVFDHHLNKDNSANVYADVIVAHDRAPHIEDIKHLRGHRCAIPGKRNQLTAAALIFNYLHSKGENLMFFGHIIDTKTQLEVLEMVSNGQAEVGILESPVLQCHKHNTLNVESLRILTTLGPLPPYRIMIKNDLGMTLNLQITRYLLKMGNNDAWLERLAPYSVTGFASNSFTNYVTPKKNIPTSVPYY